MYIIHCKYIYIYNIWLLSQRWARAYRDNKYHAAVETNNGAEALNKLLKYQYLPRGKRMMLSNMIRTIVEEFVPALHYKYIFQNFKQSNSYRSYNPAVVPSYLQGRPKRTVLHCLHRRATSNKVTKSMVKIIDDGKFEVQGKHKVHTIDFGLTSDVPTCTCKDWETHRIPCKHFFAVFNWFPEWGWERFPKSYQSSPYLCLDEDAIATYMQCNSDLSNGSPAEPHRISANIEESDEYSEVDGLLHDEDETGDQLLGEIPCKVRIILFVWYTPCT